MSYKNLSPTLITIICLVGMPAISDAYECEISKDEFKGTENVSVETEFSLSSDFAQSMIVYEKQDGQGSFAIALFFKFKTPRYLGKDVYDSNQRKLDKVIANRDVISVGTVMEWVQINVEKSYLRDHAATGIKLRIYGKRGHADASIGSDMIKDFLGCFE